MHSIFLPKKPRSVGAALIVSAVEVAQAARRVEPLPFDQWPAWAKDLAEHRQPGDAGLGDTVFCAIAESNAGKLKAWFDDKFGKSCGCSNRRRWLNQRFPYLFKPLADPITEA